MPISSTSRRAAASLALLTGARMAAAGIGPQPAGMVFSGGASMQQDSPVSIADDDGYSAVSQPVPMRLELGGRSDLGSRSHRR